MASIVVSGDTSGAITLSAPAIAGTNTLTLPARTATIDAFPSGTALLFQQTAAPTGWTKSTAHDNKALRIVSGTASSGGSVAFTTAFASQAVSGTNANTTATNNSYTPAGSVSVSGSVGSTTLGVNEIPSHTHLYQAYTIENIVIASAGPYYISSSYPIYATSATGGGGSHNHGFSGSGSFSGTAATITQAAHTHTFTGTAINLAVQYVDAIIATKD